MGEFKQRDRDDEDGELIFVGGGYVNEDVEIFFVRVILNLKLVILNILNRV